MIKFILPISIATLLGLWFALFWESDEATIKRILASKRYDAPQTQNECKYSNGSWYSETVRRIDGPKAAGDAYSTEIYWRCTVPTRDAGTACASSSQCESLCVYAGQSGFFGSKGQCYGYKNGGNSLLVMENGSPVFTVDGFNLPLFNPKTKQMETGETTSPYRSSHDWRWVWYVVVLAATAAGVIRPGYTAGRQLPGWLAVLGILFLFAGAIVFVLILWGPLGKVPISSIVR
jgi:hypothetical protein